MALFGSGTDPALLSRLRIIETKLDAIMAHLGIELAAPENDGLEHIRALIDAGEKIEAIKAYRDLTGAGLAEAKDAIDRGLPR